MSRALRRVVGFLLGMAATALIGWGALVLWFTLPLADPLPGGIALAFAGFCLIGLVAAWWRHRLLPLLPVVIGLAGVLVWWSSIEPSNDRSWQPDVARLASAEIDGERVTLRNIRNFAYRTADDYTERWYDRSVDLRQLEAVDLIAVYWGNDAIAHTMASFVFAGQPITFSIETRKEIGESYSTLAGFFRNYELTYVVADERDVVALRTSYREPPEDVYLYRVQMPRENMRKLFLAYLAEINLLTVTPKFYNSLTTNCTTNIVQHIRSYREDLPLSWKMLLSGYFAELIYESGGLDHGLPFIELRRASLINERARAAGLEDFSRTIRKDLPGM